MLLAARPLLAVFATNVPSQAPPRRRRWSADDCATVAVAPPTALAAPSDEGTRAAAVVRFANSDVTGAVLPVRKREGAAPPAGIAVEAEVEMETDALFSIASARLLAMSPPRPDVTDDDSVVAVAVAIGAVTATAARGLGAGAGSMAATPSLLGALVDGSFEATMVVDAAAAADDNDDTDDDSVCLRARFARRRAAGGTMAASAGSTTAVAFRFVRGGVAAVAVASFSSVPAALTCGSCAG